MGSGYLHIFNGVEQMIFVPITPGGTVCIWLEASTRKQAWKNLLKDAEHMPYKDKGAFVKRGYSVEKLTETTND